MSEIIGLFPTPFMRVPSALDRVIVAGLIAHFVPKAGRRHNSRDRASGCSQRAYSIR